MGTSLPFQEGFTSFPCFQWCKWPPNRTHCSSTETISICSTHLNVLQEHIISIGSHSTDIQYPVIWDWAVQLCEKTSNLLSNLPQLVILIGKVPYNHIWLFLNSAIKHADPGRGSHMKQSGMLVVSLRGVNFGFWSCLGCSGQSVNIWSRQGLV